MPNKQAYETYFLHYTDKADGKTLIELTDLHE